MSALLALLIIPLVGLVLPILLVLTAVLIDAVYAAFVGYQMWHDLPHPLLRRLLHRSR